MRLRFGDILLAVVIAAAAVILMFGIRTDDGETGVAVISRDGTEVARIDLADIEEDWKYEFEDIGVMIEAKDGQIRFIESSCLDQTCVHTGWLSRPGDTAVCLPNRVIVKIIGKQKSDVDVIAE